MSTSVSSLRFGKVGRLLAGGAALALVLAACAPATPTAAPTTVLLPSPLPTTALTTDTPAAPLATSEATSIGTSAATSMPNEAGTPVVTANATAAGTAAANAPLLIESDKLLGMAVNDSSGNPLGTIADVLVTTTGTVQAVVLNLGASAATPAATSELATPAATAAAVTPETTSAAATPAAATAMAATPVAGTQAAVTGQMVAIPWTSITADASTQRLTYQGTASDLTSLPAFDESQISTGYVVRAQGTSLPASYDGLIRLGGSLSDIDLETPANDKLGDIQHVILDLHSGMATYAVVDFGGFLGIGQESVLVPWAKLTVDNTDMTTTKPVVRLNVTKDSLQSAPKFDEGTLSFWPTPANPGWDSQIQLFWQTAAS